MEGVIDPAFARALEANRDRFNARFAQARRSFPRLDGPSFLDLLRRRIDPLVATIATRAEAHVSTVTEVLYDVSLELLGKGLIGPAARYPDYEELWFTLLSQATPLIAVSAAELVGPLSNALYNLRTTPGCRAVEWCRMMGELVDGCSDAKELLKLGVVAAWRCGLAHFRTAALELAHALPSIAVARILTPGMPVSTLLTTVEQLARDPWFNPAEPQPPAGPRLVAEVGGFRGFGGEFRRPPKVLARDGQLYVHDGDTDWVLIADIFGAVFHRARAPVNGAAVNSRFRIDKTGVVQGSRSKAQLPLLAGASSSASTETTLAVTLPHSHRVYLVAEGVG